MRTEPHLPARPTNDGTNNFEGLPIRAELAARAMQGIVSTQPGSTVITDAIASEIAKEAVRCADALIVELNKPQQ